MKRLKNFFNKSKTPHVHALCSCGWKYPKSEAEDLHEALVGNPVLCGGKDCDEIAYVVRHEGEDFWIKIRCCLKKFEKRFSKFGCRRADEHTGIYVSGITCMTIFLAWFLRDVSCPWIIIPMSLLFVYFIIETIIVLLVAAFVGRGMRDLFRSFSLFVINFIHLAAVFGFFYWRYAEYFDRRLNTIWDAFYFSLITITTIGYGDISPNYKITKILVGIEVMLGLFFLVVLLNIILSNLTNIRTSARAFSVTVLDQTSDKYFQEEK